MQLGEFKNFCEKDKRLKDLWREMVICTLKLKDVLLERTIKIREGWIPDEDAQKKFSDSLSAYSEAKDRLIAKALEIGVIVPDFHHEHICSF